MEHNEKLHEYANRFVSPHLDQRTHIIGFSFGGMLALELLREPETRTKIAGITLISGCQSADSVAYFKQRAKLTSFLPLALIKFGVAQSRRQFEKSEDLLPHHSNLLLEMERDADFDLLKWSVVQCGQWDYPGYHAYSPGLDVVHIHGRNDKVIPAYKNDPTDWIEDGKHLIQFTHADQVNRIIADQTLRLS